MPPELAPLQQQFNLTFRRGQLQLVVGRSGSMKSMWMMWYANACKLNTLYFSADMAPFHSITRLGSLLTGDRVKQIEEALDAGAEELYEDAFGSSRIEFCFESSPTLADISVNLAAYRELRNANPDLIVIDTLNNVDAETDDKYGGLRLLELELHRLARDTGAAVFVVHHTTESATPKPHPPAKRDIDGKIDKLFERIVSVFLDETTMEFKMSAVKNRDGKASASGENYVSLKADPEHARFTPWVRYGGGWQ